MEMKQQMDELERYITNKYKDTEKLHTNELFDKCFREKIKKDVARTSAGYEDILQCYINNVPQRDVRSNDNINKLSKMLDELGIYASNENIYNDLTKMLKGRE